MFGYLLYCRNFFLTKTYFFFFSEIFYLSLSPLSSFFYFSDMKLLIKKRAKRLKRRVCFWHRDSGDRQDTCSICSSSWLPGHGAYWPILLSMVCCLYFTLPF